MKIAYKCYDALLQLRFNPFAIASRVLTRLMRKPLKHIKKILLIRLDGIGDIILWTPSLKTIRDNFPDAEITVLCSPAGKLLLESCPAADKILCYDYFSKNPYNYCVSYNERKKIKSLLAGPYDLCMDFRTDKRTSLFCFLANARIKAGYDVHGSGWYLNYKTYARTQKHMTEKGLDVCRALDLKISDTEPFVWYTDDDQKSALKISPESPYIAIHPGAGEPFKQWPADKFAQLADMLIEKTGYPVYFIGGPADIAKASEICSQMKEKAAILCGTLPFPVLTAFLAKSALFIGNDSGPMHIAAAAGAKTLVIQALSTNPIWWKPQGKRVLVIRAEEIPDDIHGITKISVDSVFLKACRFLEEHL